MELSSSSPLVEVFVRIRKVVQGGQQSLQPVCGRRELRYCSRSVCKASFGSLAQFLEDSNFDAQFGSFQTSKSTRTRGGTGHRGAEDRVERGDRT